jgi:hypothetical protein
MIGRDLRHVEYLQGEQESENESHQRARRFRKAVQQGRSEWRA